VHRNNASNQRFFARGVRGRAKPTHTSTAVIAEMCSDPRGAALKEDLVKWARVVKAAGITID